MSEIMRADHLVIGSGIAGLSYALKVADAGSVLVVTKKDRSESNTHYAQGGIAAVLDPTDSFESHVRDTLQAGSGLCDDATVRSVIADGPDRVRELARLGASFSRDGDGAGAESLALGQEGGHSARRIVHAADATGREIERALVAAVAAHPSIRVLDHHRAFELVTCPRTGRCLGALVRAEESGECFAVLTSRTFLATGGASCIYRHTTNPEVTTGDGLAMAYRAGARITNMEFVQFHPTALRVPGTAPFLVSEALRGEGAILRNLAGERFMPAHDPRAELAPRDIVARAIHGEMTRRGDDHVWLDISHGDPGFLARRFPQIHGQCLSHGIDMRIRPIPVTPAAHYTCGGVWTDTDGRTDVPGLWAAGEVTCTGLHGANRLASNSLLEAVVYAHRAALSSIDDVSDVHREPESVEAMRSQRSLALAANRMDTTRCAEMRSEILEMMWEDVAIVRSRSGLSRVRARLSDLGEQIRCGDGPVHPDDGEMTALWTVARLVVASALAREESRGLHFVADHPRPVDPPRNTVLVRGPSGEPRAAADPWESQTC